MATVFRDTGNSRIDPKFKRSEGLLTSRVVGMEELRRRLRKLPYEINVKVMRPAISQSATILRRYAKRLAPVSGNTVERGRNSLYQLKLQKQGVDKRYKHVSLRDAIRKQLRRGVDGSIYAVVGPGYMVAPHDHLVHDGTKPHSLGKKHYKLVNAKGNRVKRVLRHQSDGPQHPGSRPNPFMEDAMALSAAEVRAKMVAVARSKMQQLGIR